MYSTDTSPAGKFYEAGWVLDTLDKREMSSFYLFCEERDLISNCSWIFDQKMVLKKEEAWWWLV